MKPYCYICKIEGDYPLDEFIHYSCKYCKFTFNLNEVITTFSYEKPIYLHLYTYEPDYIHIRLEFQYNKTYIISKEDNYILPYLMNIENISNIKKYLVLL